MDERTPYERLGGDAEVRALVDRFYDAMDVRPDAAAIRAMHPADLTGSREKLHEFLSGWMGGPPLYVEKHGHPMLRRRHFPFPVDAAAADAWMACMVEALEPVPDVQLREWLATAFRRVADHMRNR
ncbi:MAG: group II truncated hemoglobin [Alphaproteobacteria bacterium]|nr:group II truncated hemoglobin [Alphaproteobacteria bacterium]